jgi:hypothetical protein
MGHTLLGEEEALCYFDIFFGHAGSKCQQSACRAAAAAEAVVRSTFY